MEDKKVLNNEELEKVNGGVGGGGYRPGDLCPDCGQAQLVCTKYIDTYSSDIHTGSPAKIWWSECPNCGRTFTYIQS